MGLKVITDDYPVTVRCFDKTSAAGNPYKDYAISVGTKNDDGTWKNGLFNVRFKKGVEIPDKTKIYIDNCFPIVSEYNGKSYINWMITDFEIDGESAPQTNNDFMNIPDEIDEEVPW